MEKIPTVPNMSCLETSDLAGPARLDKRINQNDVLLIAQMARNQSSPSTIAAAIGMMEADLYSKENMTIFETIFMRARAMGIALINEAQFELGVTDRNPQMLIHLGKVFDAQAETTNVNLLVTDVTKMDLVELERKLVNKMKAEEGSSGTD